MSNTPASKKQVDALLTDLKKITPTSNYKDGAPKALTRMFEGRDGNTDTTYKLVQDPTSETFVFGYGTDII